MVAVTATKQELRSTYRTLRASLGQEARAHADALIAQRVCGSLAFRDATAVFTYLSFGDEVDTRAIIQEAWRQGKTVAIPRVTGEREMRWFAIESFDGLETSKYGIDEPPIDKAREVFPGDYTKFGDNAAIALVPALAFDGLGYRLGYGGGFYDVFLHEFAGMSIGLCRTAQISLQPLPHERHDVRVDVVMCEE